MPEDKLVCILLNDAIKDEKDAVDMYHELKETLSKAESLDIDSRFKIDAIIEQEKNHREWLERIAEKNSCSVEEKPYRDLQREGKKPRVLWADLPLKERIAMAKALVSKSERMT